MMHDTMGSGMGWIMGGASLLTIACCCSRLRRSLSMCFSAEYRLDRRASDQLRSLRNDAVRHG